MKSVSRILLAAALAVAFVVSASANDRENFSVGHLQVENDIDLTGGTMSNGTLVGMTSTSETLTEPAINGRAAVLSSSATAERVVEFFTGATNGQIIVYTTPFTGTPAVTLTYVGGAATNQAAYLASSNPTQAVITATGAGTVNGVVVGTK